MRSHLCRSARWALGLFLLVLIEPSRCGVPSLNAQTAHIPPLVVISEGETSQGYPYLFGGVSSNEREVMEGRAKDYNLKLVFAEKSGAYLSGVMVILATARGIEIISVATNGPWFFIQLPPGNYSVKASLAGDAKQIKNLRVAKDKSIRQIFTWDLGEQLT